MSILERFKSSQAERKKQRVEEDATYIYQIKEYNGELWLTFRESLVCPCSMLKEEPVDAVKAMRDLFIKKNSI